MINSSPILPFVIDFESSKLEKVTFKTTKQSTQVVNGETVTTTETKKKEVSIITAGASKHQVLHCLSEFNSARQSLRWTTGPKLFEMIVDILQAHSDRVVWNSKKTAAGSETVNNFTTVTRQFIKHKFSNNTNAYQTHKRFLQQIKKTREHTVSDFISLLNYHNDVILPLLPGAPPTSSEARIDDTDLKFVIFDAMPSTWKTDYDKHFDLNESTIDEITTYMEKCHFASISKDKKDEKKNKNKDKNQDENSKNGNKRNGKRRGNGNGNRNSNSRRGNNQSNTISPDDPCPIHIKGNHKWGDCNLNAHNANRRSYNSNRSNGQNRQQNSNSNNSNRNGNDSHMNDNNSQQSTDRNPQSGDNHFNFRDNHYCQPCNDSKSDETADTWIDLFHVDCTVDDEYYSKDLQRFPIEKVATESKFEEIFATDSSVELKKDQVLSSVPPTDSEYVPLTTTVKEDDIDLAPTTVACCNKINNSKGKFYLKTLFDSGSTDNILTRSAIPANTEIFKLKTPISMSTAKGEYSCTDYAYLENVMFPELSYSRKCKQIKVYIVDAKMIYHLIIGRKYMKQIALKMDFESSTIQWYDKEMKFHPRSYFTDSTLLRKIMSNEPYSVAESYAAQTQQEGYVDSSTKYMDTDLKALVKLQSHLTQDQQDKLLDILSNFEALFEGLNNRELGIFPNREYKIELIDGAKPFHIKQAYSIPINQREAVKKELFRQVKLGILIRCYATEWGMPCFVVPKPDGSCRLIADFRELNKVTKKLVYPLPKIQDIFHRRRGFLYVTLLDVSMQFHTFMLEEGSSWLCVIVTPFGKFRLARLPMGFLNSPSWAQGAMEELFAHLSNVEVYIDDIGIFSNDFQSHCKTVFEVLKILQDHNFSIKPAKCHWFQSSAPWLGHIISTDGIRPNPEKIAPILKLAFPRTVTELRSFIGMVNFYRNFWRKRAELMAPLTALCGRSKGKLTCTPELLRSFNAIKALIAEEVLLAYPDPNLTYDVYTDASDYQMGAVLMQEGRTIAFFSRKLTSAQLKYPTIDKEMLCIVEVFKEFRTILWGAKIRVHTDHVNLTRQNISSNRIMTWRMLLEEFSPVFHYIKGPDNIIADALSRLPFEEEKRSTPSATATATATEEKFSPSTEAADSKTTSTSLDLSDLFINYPSDLPQFPIAFDRLAQAQAEDESIQATDYYQDQVFYEHTLKVYTKNGNTKIALPRALLTNTIKWYHHVLGHCGIERLIKSISQHLYAPGLKDAVTAFIKTCDACQRYKNPGAGSGYLATRQEIRVPWEEIAIDTIGPWNIQLPGIGKVSFCAFTIIDNCTNILEIKRASKSNPTGLEAVHALDDAWLSRYPKPVRCIYDQGTEYRNIDFESHLISLGIKPVPTSVKNPQANAILERVHDVMKTAMRTELNSNPPQDQQEAANLIDRVLASAQYAVRCTVHKTFGISPGSIAFNRDMLLPIPIISDATLLREKRQAVIDKNALKENRRRKAHEYNVGDSIAILAFNPGALDARATGPFIITQVHTNGTVSFLRNEEVIERINIRRIKPYFAA